MKESLKRRNNEGKEDDIIVTVKKWILFRTVAAPKEHVHVNQLEIRSLAVYHNYHRAQMKHVRKSDCVGLF